MTLLQSPAERVADVLRSHRSASTYDPKAVKIGGRSHDASDPGDEDFEIFVAEMTVIARRTRDLFIGDMIARNASWVWDAVRLVNRETKNGFKGAGARGQELLFNPLSERDTGSAGGYPGTNPLTDWYVNQTTVAAARLYPAANTVDLTVGSLPVLSHVIFGFTNPVIRPKARSVQLVRSSDPWPEEFMTLEWRRGGDENEVPVYELRQPWVMVPGQSYRVNVRYTETGEDRLQPIGFAVMRAQEILASLAT